MTTIDATLSMLESMPEEARLLVYQYTKQLFTARKPANPFTPVDAEQILADLQESRRQFAEGQGAEIEEALREMGKKHGFV